MKMKSVILIACLIYTSLSARQAHADVHSAFSKAQEYATAAALNSTDPELSSAFKTIRDAFPSAEVLDAPNGKEFTDCAAKPALLAFTIPAISRTKIVLCKRVLYADDETLAEVFIHELAHIAIPTTDECLATKIELAVMKAVHRVPFKNVFVDKCGLDQMGPFSQR